MAQPITDLVGRSHHHRLEWVPALSSRLIAVDLATRSALIISRPASPSLGTTLAFPARTAGITTVFVTACRSGRMGTPSTG